MGQHSPERSKRSKCRKVVSVLRDSAKVETELENEKEKFSAGRGLPVTKLATGGYQERR